MLTIIGLDLAKHVFQVHGVDATVKPMLRKRLRRSEVARFFAALSPCVVGIEDAAAGITGHASYGALAITCG